LVGSQGSVGELVLGPQDMPREKLGDLVGAVLASLAGVVEVVPPAPDVGRRETGSTRPGSHEGAFWLGGQSTLLTGSAGAESVERPDADVGQGRWSEAEATSALGCGGGEGGFGAGAGGGGGGGGPGVAPGIAIGGTVVLPRRPDWRTRDSPHGVIGGRGELTRPSTAPLSLMGTRLSDEMPRDGQSPLFGLKKTFRAELPLCQQYRNKEPLQCFYPLA